MRKTAIVPLGFALAASLAAAGCASVGAGVEPNNEFAAGRGRSIAQIQCSGCHQIGPAGESANPMAPPFRVIRLRYNDLSFARRMAQVGDDGHYEMPGFNLPRADVDDVAAYIDSFKGQ